MLRRKSAKISTYDLWQLIDSRKFEDLGRCLGKEQLICDIDKTYLETNFDSWKKMAKIAFEGAVDKITVAGASEVLLAARWGDLRHELKSSAERDTYPRPLHFVSASPPQLRHTLEEKLMLDGLDWSSDTFKNQAYNLRKRQFGLLRQQVAYKTAAILKIMEKQADTTNYFLIGDNAESDPFIYLGIRLLVECHLSQESFAEYLGIMGVEAKIVEAIWQGLDRLPKGNVRAILIRNLNQNMPYQEKQTEKIPIIQFDSYFEVALYFFCFKLIDAQTLGVIIKNMHNRHGLALADARRGLLACLQLDLPKALLEDLQILYESLDFAASYPCSQPTFFLANILPDDFSELSETQILANVRSWAKQLKSNHDTEA